jgi:hypothetical protein
MVGLLSQSNRYRKHRDGQPFETADLLPAMDAHAILSRSAKPLQNHRIQVLDEKTSSTLVG